MMKYALKDVAESFNVAVLEAAEPSRVVLFAVGGGGNPERHVSLLTTLAGHSCTVVAPYFDRLATPVPTESDLLLRSRRLRLALDSVMRSGLPVAGVGHSIGASMLLALAGGQMWMRTGQRLFVTPDTRLCRLVLLAPAMDFFEATGALDAVRTPIQAWVGTKDTITPPAQTEFLRRALDYSVQVNVCLVEGAGHFSFMDEPPPQTADPLSNRDTFLAHLAAGVSHFVMS